MSVERCATCEMPKRWCLGHAQVAAHNRAAAAMGLHLVGCFFSRIFKVDVPAAPSEHIDAVAAYLQRQEDQLIAASVSAAPKKRRKRRRPPS